MTSVATWRVSQGAAATSTIQVEGSTTPGFMETWSRHEASECASVAVWRALIEAEEEEELHAFDAAMAEAREKGTVSLDEIRKKHGL